MANNHTQREPGAPPPPGSTVTSSSVNSTFDTNSTFLTSSLTSSTEVSSHNLRNLWDNTQDNNRKLLLNKLQSQEKAQQPSSNLEWILQWSKWTAGLTLATFATLARAVIVVANAAVKCELPTWQIILFALSSIYSLYQVYADTSKMFQLPDCNRYLPLKVIFNAIPSMITTLVMGISVYVGFMKTEYHYQEWLKGTKLPKLSFPGADLQPDTRHQIAAITAMACLAIAYNIYSVNQIKFLQIKPRIFTHQFPRTGYRIADDVFSLMEKPVFAILALLFTSLELSWNNLFKQLFLLALGVTPAILAAVTTVAAWTEHTQDELNFLSSGIVDFLAYTTMLARVMYGMCQGQGIMGRLFDMFFKGQLHCPYLNPKYVARNPFLTSYRVISFLLLGWNAYGNGLLSATGGKMLPGGILLPYWLSLITGTLNSASICMFSAFKGSLNFYTAVHTISSYIETPELNTYSRMGDDMEDAVTVPEVTPEHVDRLIEVTLQKEFDSDWCYKVRENGINSVSMTDWCREKIALLSIIQQHLDDQPNSAGAVHKVEATIDALHTILSMLKNFWFLSEDKRQQLYALSQHRTDTDKSTLRKDESEAQFNDMDNRWCGLMGFFGMRKKALNCLPDEKGHYGDTVAMIRLGQCG